MNMFCLWYTKEYYITHPHKLISDIATNIKWAWQRVYRGWDDRVIWGISEHIFEMMPEWLRTLKENTHGISTEFFEQDDDTIEVAEMRFRKVLDEMIAGFESGAKFVSDDLDVYNDFEKFVIEKHGEKILHTFEDINDKESPYNVAWREFDVIEKREKEIEKLKSELDRALELFCEYYITLSD